MKKRFQTAIVVLSLSAMLAGSVVSAPMAHAETGTCKHTTPPAETYQAFTAENFWDANGDGIPEGWAGWSDYAEGACHRAVETQSVYQLSRWVYRSRSVQKIFASSSHNPPGEDPFRPSGDVSIVRVFKLPTDGTRRFQATAVVDISSLGGDFRGRLKMVGLKDNYEQVGLEFFKDICTPAGVALSERTDYDNQLMCQRSDSGSFQTLTVTTPTLPTLATRIAVTWRAHEHKTDSAWGTATLDKLTFTKI